jgi:hypothetical protein
MVGLGRKRELSLERDYSAVSCRSEILDFLILKRLIKSVMRPSSIICDSGRYG